MRTLLAVTFHGLRGLGPEAMVRSNFAESGRTGVLGQGSKDPEKEESKSQGESFSDGFHKRIRG